MQGRLDLSSVDFDEVTVVDLNGQWELYWNQLLPPDRIQGAEGTTGYFDVPGVWNGHEVDGHRVGGDGYATFRLRVRLPAGAPALAVRTEEQATAYRLWVNGAEVLASGVVGTSPADSTPRYRISTAVLPGGTPVLDCVLQVSNFHAAEGGPNRSIALGSPEAIQRLHSGRLTLDVLEFGALCVVGLIHLIFFALRRKDRSPLYFGAFCVAWGVNTAFGGNSGRFAALLFPGIPWYWQVRGDYLTWFLSVPVLIMFYRVLFPEEFSLRLQRVALAVTLLTCLLVIVVPSRRLDLAADPFQLFSLVVAPWTCWLLFRATRRRRSGAALLLFGQVAFVATVVNDLLRMDMLIGGFYLVHAGTAVLIACQAVVVSQRFARSFATVEALSAELSEKNVALSRMDELKDQFLANTSHELRTPLNGIVGLADSLLSGIAGPLSDKIRHDLAMISGSGRRLSALINDILDFSRLRNRDVRIRRQPVDLHALAELVLHVMRPLAHGKPVEIRNEIPGDLPPALGDEGRLQQVLYNLVGNAIKFTDRGTICVRGRALDSRIELAVSDTGIGIPADRHDVIFRSFEQVDASDARVHGGAGLGLAITRQLVELHEGSIAVEASPGAGSTFRVILPAADPLAAEPPRPMAASGLAVALPSAAIAAARPPTVLPGVEGPVAILAVDDDPVNLQVITNYLAFQNLTVQTAAGGQEALAILESGPPPDLVLLDLMMPRVTGHEVCRRLRQRYSPSVLPVIILTAKSGSQDLVEAFAEGANDYLVKPFTRDELLARAVSQLKLGRSYLTLRENLCLRRELEERKATERELRLVQRRLTGILDSIDVPLLAVNEAEEITFCNGPCEALLGKGAEALLGRPLQDLLRHPAADGHAVRRCVEAGASEDLGPIVLVRGDGTDCRARLHSTRLDVEDEPICLLLIRDLGLAEDGSGAQDLSQSLAAVERINQNRARLRRIQSSLNGLTSLVEQGHPGVLHELGSIDDALEGVGRDLLQGETHASRRHLAVEVMTCALECWTLSTGLTKADLATQSGLWRTYTNRDGWERTQTLDRYLRIETFPQRPSWAKVMRTAEFVLSFGPEETALRSRLEVLLDRLRVSR